MAQTGYTPISIYYSSTATNVPTAGNLVAGELAINTNDGILYYKDSSGVVQSIASKAGNSGSFTNLAYTGTLTGGTGVVNLGSGQFYKDASGNVGIGTSSPTNKLHAVSNVSDSTDSSYAIVAGNLTTQTKKLLLGYNGTGNYGVIQAVESGTAWRDIVMQPNGGNLLVGTTATGAQNSNSFGTQLAFGQCNFNHINGTGSGTGYSVFNYNGSTIGSITQAGTTGVLYNVTSDYRLKNNVTPIQNALATVEALNPVSFTWVDGRNDDGFLAHELQAVIPNCVTGEKDAVNEDGTPKYQQMDNSGVVPFLVKAIQELNAKIDAQTTTIAALQAKVG